MRVNVFVKRLSIIAPLLLLSLAANVPAQAENCEIRLTECPQAYDGKELVVPLNVAALSTNIRPCGVKGSVESSGGGAPAIMFLIDHTRSMTTSSDDAGSPGADVNGNRFRVTRALVDTIAKVYPGAQIGVAVFGEGLVLDYTWDGNLVPFNGITNSFGGHSQGYLPIRALNAQADSGAYAYSYGDKPSWLNVIQGMFSVPKVQTAKSTLRKPLRSGDASSDTIVAESGGTNISIAFEAAVEAFAAIDTTYTPKRNRYIILISDGGPELYSGKQQTCDGIPNSSNSRCIMQDDFVNGTVWNEAKQTYLSIPTTYTVFLTAGSPPNMPEKLVTMTTNIRKNGYSESNMSSSIWSLSANYSGLLRTMMNIIVIPILDNSTGAPKTIVISTPNVKDSASVIGGAFAFNKQLLPINTAEVTEIRIGISYDVQVDSTYKDGSGEHTISLPSRDSLFNYSFTIRRSADVGENWLSGQGLDCECNNMAVYGASRVVPNTSGKEAVAVVAPVAALTYTFTIGPNPAGKSSGAVSFFWSGGDGIKSGNLSVYDASGNLVKKIPVSGKLSGRKVGWWDLTDRKGRAVYAGTYLVKGVLKTSGGKREKVSVVVGVR